MNQNPDVVVMDHFLDEDDRGMTGLDYLNKIKKTFKSVEVIMISATDDIRLAVYSLRKGAVTYIQKGKDAMYGLMQAIQKAMLNIAKSKEGKDQRNFKFILGVTLAVILSGFTIMNLLGDTVM